MIESRAYAATTGRCVAGDRDTDYKTEQKRVKRDFAAGVRFVVDTLNGEIRGFVPIDRGSREAFFFTTVFGDDEVVTLSAYLESVEDILEERRRWKVPTDTPEKHLLASVRDVTRGKIHSVTIGLEDQLSAREQEALRVGVPGYEAGIAHLSRHHPTPDPGDEPETNHVSVVGLSRTVNHVNYDVLYHVSRDYNSPTVLRSE